MITAVTSMLKGCRELYISQKLIYLRIRYIYRASTSSNLVRFLYVLNQRYDDEEIICGDVLNDGITNGFRTDQAGRKGCG